MTDRVRALLILLGLVVVAWLGLTLASIHAELVAIRQSLVTPRAAQHQAVPPPAVPSVPGARLI